MTLSRIPLWRLRLETLALVALFALGACAATAATTLPGFVIENAYPGARFNLPAALAFLPDGRLLVAEKRGVVWVVQGGTVRTKPFWSAEKEVLANGDRGLIGMAVDPGFSLNHRVYFYYTVDPDSNGVDDNGGSFTRITRYTASAADSNVSDSTSRTVLLGATWASGIPSPSLSHAVDCLAFGSDGSLLVTHGDGSHFEYPDWGGHDPQVFQPGRTDSLEDIGSFRAQYLGSLAGKLLRINPENGYGYASNPYATADLTAPQSKVWAYGLRNPFRFCMRPGTGSADTTAGNPGVAYVGDVGATNWEELDVVTTPGMNFGWPCREGNERYVTLADVTPAHHGCSSIGTADNPASPTGPRFVWSHTDSTRSVPYGLRGNCTAGGIFYTGSRYPESYRGKLFFGDFGGNWLRVATLDEDHEIESLQDFASGLDGPVDWALDPVSGELCYASIVTGEVRRIRYAGGEGAATVTARASANPIAHSSPATIDFSSLGSFDSGGGSISCAWSFGDGTPGSTSAHPSHVYALAGEYTAILTVTGTTGALARDTLAIVVLRDSAVPATASLGAFDGADGALGPPWVGNLNGLALRGNALVQTTPSNYCMWGTTYGANQEAHVRFDSISAAAPEHDLLLKVQGASWTSGAIQVVYDATGSVMAISTYTPVVGWAHIAGPWRNIHFNAGDVFSARALSNGVLEIYRNQDKLGDCLIDTWKFCRSGGRIGLMLKGAAGSRLTEFGGGTLSVRDNEAPVAGIVSPVMDSFYAEGEPVPLRATAHDEDDADSTLRYHWSVSIHHNNHFHPDVMTSDSAVDSLIAENHDDGTGISLLVRLVVSDPRGGADTAEVVIHPRVNLTPSEFAVLPARPLEGAPATFAFTLANSGPMPAPRSRWRLRLDGVIVAEGDTIVAARGSVRIVREVFPISALPHVIRAEVDAFGEVLETDETDNGTERAWAPLPFPTSRVLDSFERAEGTQLPLGNPWLGSLAGLAIRDLALTQNAATSYAIWNDARFGPDQEAFFRFDSTTTAAPEHSVLLKVQRTSWNGGAVQVAYSAATSSVSIFTYSPLAGWVRRGGPWSNVRFGPGDQLGARALAGNVTAFRNGSTIGSASLDGWEFAAAGGRVGLMLRGATQSRLVDFGGGNVADTTVSRPRASILAPADSTLVPAGDSLALRGSGSDAEDDSSQVRLRWLIEAPATLATRTGAAAVCAIPAEASGPFRVRLIATDSGGRTDTASVWVRAGAGTLDRFQRPDGPPGAPWTGTVSAFAIRDSALVLTGASGYLTWNAGPFGADQEAWMEFDSVATGAPEHDLLLKVQGTSWSSGAIQVLYSAPLAQIVLNTYSPGAGWTRRAGPWRNITFGPGDRLGARATSDGRVRVLRNGSTIGEASLLAWPAAIKGGRIGLILNGAAGARIARFGGGAFADTLAAAHLAGRGAAAFGTSTAHPDGVPREYLRVSQAIPNPVPHEATFALELPRAARVGMTVYDILGREVWSREPGEMPAGNGRIHWPGNDARGTAVPVGVYLARIAVDQAIFLRRLTVIH